MSILDKILETKQTEITAAKSVRDFESVEAEARAVKRTAVSFSQALVSSPTGIIAEFKRRSPSKGYIKEGADVRTIVAGYSASGAAAISVLTDSDYFGGSLDDLRAAREVSDRPLLRKDFIVDPYQICEARIAGADVILLIAAALTPVECLQLASFAAQLGLEVLLEVHNEAEIGHVNPYVNVVGINNRNLATFVTDTDLSRSLGKLLPHGAVKISESGISSPQTVLELRAEGFQGFLMGENFMKESHPDIALCEFIKDLRA